MVTYEEFMAELMEILVGKRRLYDLLPQYPSVISFARWFCMPRATNLQFRNYILFMRFVIQTQGRTQRRIIGKALC